MTSPNSIMELQQEIIRRDETIRQLEAEILYLEELKDWYKDELDTLRGRTDNLIKRLANGL